MNINEDMLCPVCQAKLFTDEVAFCPECGAPHHKKCFLGLGHCFYADKHGTPEQWQPPKIEPPKATNTDNSNVIQNTVDNGGYNTNGFGVFNGVNQNTQQNNNSSTQNPFFSANGIDKDEVIDGEKTENIAKFVGYNALRYINVFRKMANLKKKTSWNWLGFLIPEFWLISRKCYIQSILIGFYSVLMSVVSSMAMANTAFQSFLQTDILNDGSKSILGVVFVGSLIMLLIRVFFGLFGDYIYKKKVYSTIKEMKQNGTTSDLDFMRIGGVNLFLPVLLYLGIYALSVIILEFIML